MAQVLLYLEEPALSAHSGLFLSLSIGFEELPLTLMGSLGCPAHGPRARVSHDLSLLFSESLLLFISSKQHGHGEMEVCSCLCILHVPSNIQGKWQALQALPPNLSHVPGSTLALSMKVGVAGSGQQGASFPLGSHAESSRIGVLGKGLNTPMLLPHTG